MGPVEYHIELKIMAYDMDRAVGYYRMSVKDFMDRELDDLVAEGGRPLGFFMTREQLKKAKVVVGDLMDKMVDQFSMEANS